MATKAFLKVEGIRGPIQQSGREETMEVVEINHGVTTIEIPTTIGTNTPRTVTAHPRHEPLIITKDLDIGSPKLIEFLHASRPIPTVEVSLWRISGRGQAKFYSIELTNAKIIDIEFEMPEDGIYKEREWVSFNYEAIKWIYTSRPGGQEETFYSF